MYGVDRDTDLDFLRGRVVQQVCFGIELMNLFCDGNVRINVEGEIAIGDKGEFIRGTFKDSSLLAWLLMIVGDTITEASPMGPKVIELKFGSGRVIHLIDSNDHYESFQIMGNGIAIIV